MLIDLCCALFYHHCSQNYTNNKTNEAFKIAVEEQNLNPATRKEIDLNLKLIPIQIFRSEFLKGAAGEISRFDSFSKNFSEKITKSISEIKDSYNSAKDLHKEIDNKNNEANYMGLSNGFKDAIIKKTNELKQSNKAIRNLRATALLVPTASFIALLFSQPEGYSGLLMALPLATMTGLLIYYLRVVHNEKRSIQAQLIQLELRNSLCRFIHEYSKQFNDSKTGKTDSYPPNRSRTLDKFEDLIFSGIVSKEEDLPSAYDGIDQVSNLIKALKARLGFIE